MEILDENATHFTTIWGKKENTTNLYDCPDIVIGIKAKISKTLTDAILSEFSICNANQLPEF